MARVGREIPQLDLEMRSGDYWSQVLDFDDGGDHNRDGIVEDPGNPSALPVNGFTFLAQIRSKKTDTGTPLATITVDTTDAASGRLVLSLTATQTRALNDPVAGKDSARAVWDLQAAPSGDSTKPVTWLEGSVTIAQDVSRT